MAARNAFVAIFRWGAGADHRRGADPGIGAAGVGANSDAFAVVVDSRKLALGGIRVQVNRGFGQDPGDNLVAQRVERHFFPGGKGHDVALWRVDDGR